MPVMQTELLRRKAKQLFLYLLGYFIPFSYASIIFFTI